MRWGGEPDIRTSYNQGMICILGRLDLAYIDHHIIPLTYINNTIFSTKWNDLLLLEHEANNIHGTMKRGGSYISSIPPVRPSVPHAVSGRRFIAYFTDDIHIWHRHNTWGGDVSHAIFRSYESIKCLRSDGGILEDHRYWICSLIWLQTLINCHMMWYIYSVFQGVLTFISLHHIAAHVLILKVGTGIFLLCFTTFQNPIKPKSEHFLN